MMNLDVSGREGMGGTGERNKFFSAGPGRGALMSRIDEACIGQGHSSYWNMLGLTGFWG